MALPKSGTTNRVANGLYRMTNDGNDDSDDDINVDDIELWVWRLRLLFFSQLSSVFPVPTFTFTICYFETL